MRMATRRAAGLLLGASLAAATAAAQQAAAPVPLASRTPMDFIYLKERPLFSPERAAPQLNVSQPATEPEQRETEPPAVQETVTPPDWELVGVVRSDRVNIVLFRANGDDETFVLTKGEAREGWTLFDVGRFAVVLKNGAEQARITFPKQRSGDQESTRMPNAMGDSNSGGTSEPKWMNPSPVQDERTPAVLAPSAPAMIGPSSETFTPARAQ